jgi:hypothetical protein
MTPTKVAIRDAHAGEVGRLGKAVLDPPFGDIRLGEGVPQKAEARELHGIGEGRRLHVANLGLEEVARRRAGDIDRPGQRMDPVQVAAAQILCRGGLADLAVESVARLDLDFFARRSLDDRRDRLVPAIVALARLLGEALRVIDRDALHAPPEPRAIRSRLCGWPVRGKYGGTRLRH